MLPSLLNYYPMVTRLLLFLLTVLSLPSCHVGTSGTWKNENIDPATRQQIHQLNDQLMKAIRLQDEKAVKALFSEQLLQTAKDLAPLLQQVSPAFQAGSYHLLDEFNIHNSTTEIGNTIPAGLTGANAYTIHYQALNKEMFVSLWVPDSLDNEVLVMAIYGKYGQEWKINILQIGSYSLFNQTAPAYYQLAKDSYEKSRLIDAINNISLAKVCLRPGKDYFQYQQEKEIDQFYDKVMQEVNAHYQFPLPLDKIATKPKVVRIFPEMCDEGFFPMVYYVSDIALQDTIALKAENQQVQKQVNTLFPGINQDKKYVFYQAFNEIPDGKKEVKHYGFIAKLTHLPTD